MALALKKRVKNPRKIDFFEGSFEAQINFVKSHQDRALMAAQCTRRAAKSYSCGLHFFEDSKRFPNENYVYFTLTRETARKIFWKSVLKAIDSKFNVGCNFNESRLECTTPWGAQITCIGVDSDEREKEKVLGQKLRWGYGDESAFFNIDLEEMVYDMLLPATADLNGGVTLISTTSNRVNSFFHKITTGEVKGWDVHKWSYKDNPYTAKSVQLLIDKIVADNPLKATTPGFRQMYLNEWVIDLSALVYKFSRDKNLIYKKPDTSGFSFVIGIDLGFDDASSITVLGYNQIDKTLYILESYGKSGLDITAVANEIRRTMQRYPRAPLIVDGANKQAVEEIIRRHSLPLISAKKQDKFDHIQIMNSDFITGNIKLFYDGCIELIEEYEQLVWDERKLPKRVELASKDNHRCFIAGTQISKPNGSKSIEQIKYGDVVLTRKGPRKVCRLFESEDDVIELIFKDGNRIMTTGNHPFFTANNGFVSAEKLTGNDLCLMLQEKKLFMMALSGVTFQILSACLIVDTFLRQLMGKPFDSIGMFTKSILEKLAKVSQYTTKTEILEIIQSKILSAWKILNTHLSIWMRQGEKNQERQLRRQLQKRQSGISQKKALNGIRIMEEFFQKILSLGKRPRKELALLVGRFTLSISLLELAKIIVALGSVSQKREGILDLMMLRENVDIVKKHSKLINILSKYAVVTLALSKTTGKKEKVYNIEVEEEHEYFANRVLVSNCDSALYGYFYTYSYITKIDKEPKNERDRIEEWKEKERKAIEARSRYQRPEGF